MDIKLCTDCGIPLTPSLIKNKKIRCTLCIANKRIEYLVSEEYTKATFSKTWSKNIYLRYKAFLEENKIGKEKISKTLKKASDTFLEAEKCFNRPHLINAEWINDVVNRIDPRGGHKPSLESFLVKEGIISLKNEEKRLEGAIERQISKVPEKFRRLIEVYYNEKRFLRKRQIEQNARKPLSMKTIETDIGIFLRFSNWIDELYPEISTWGLLQEEHVHSFLVTLSNQQREIVRKNLNILFKLAKKKRMIIHIPIMDSPAREYPRKMEPLTIEEQKTIAKVISANIYKEPLSCLLASFCFYHGLSSKEISSIKINHINLDGKCIYINERPPVYLTNEDLLILQNYAEERAIIKNIDKKTYLFVSKAFSYEDKPVRKGFINNYVKELTGHTPKRLRISCFSALSAMYGPQYLIEAFGLSLTQSSRYGKMEEFLVEEEVREQREGFLEYSTKLNR